MNRLLTLASALSLSVSVAMAQEVKTEKQVTTERTEDGVQTTQKTEVTVSQYVDRVRTAYREANIPDEKIERLIELDRKIFEARRAGNEAQVRVWIQEQRRILSEPEIRRVIVYLRDNPVTIVSPPDYFISTWEAPQYRSVIGVDVGGGTAATGASGGTVDVNRTGVRTGTDVDVNRTGTTGQPGAVPQTGASGQMGTGTTGQPGAAGTTGGTSDVNTGTPGSTSSGTSPGTSGTDD